MPYKTYVPCSTKGDKMVVVKKRTKFLRKFRKKIQNDRTGVLLSINTKKQPAWLDELLEKRENIYSQWSIRDAFEGMQVWISESEKGLSCYAKIGNINLKNNKINVKLVEAEKIDEPIIVEELRDLGIIKKNTPRTLQYLTKEQCKKLEDLFK